jgi:hypothetical protein
LTGREQKILLPYIANDYRSRRIVRTDPVAQGLADDSILCAPDVPIDASGGKAYNIQDWARVYLKKNLDLVREGQGSNTGAQGNL